ncbi:MAG TPA: hypothetical protein VNY29_18880 [Terriglobales bacterium]|jgi:hypothetical protein|nr:hypothetical protein [Terriglobales bacterium]
MDVSAAQMIRAELRKLMLRQTKALEAETFGGLSEKEWQEFDARQERILVLVAQLVPPDPGSQAA